MPAAPSTGESPSAATPAPNILSADQPYGLITLPLAFTTSLRLTPEQFEEVCQANPEAVIELAADGSLIASTPVGGETSLRNAELLRQVQLWASGSGGWVAFGSSTGFRLPDNSVLSPDVSLVALNRWRALTPEQRRGFAPLCPNLVVELVSPIGINPIGINPIGISPIGVSPTGASPSEASPSEACPSEACLSEISPSDDGPRGLTALRQKMAAYQRNGARLGWLLIPEERAVEVWGPLEGGEQGRRIETATRLKGGAEFPGLVIDLEPIWAE